jgi:hypothetical protein
MQRRTSGIWLIAATMILPASAYGQVYLHNSRDAAAIEKARAGLEPSRAAFLAALDENSRVLAELMSAERLAALNSGFARRDQELAAVIDRQGSPQAVVDLRTFISNRINALAADPQPAGMGLDLELDARRRRFLAARRDLDNYLALRDNAMTTFRQAGGRRGTPCNDSGLEGTSPPTDTPADARQHYNVALALCPIIRERKQAEARASAGLSPALAIAFGASPPASQLPAGLLRDAVEQRQTLRELSATQARLAASVKNYLQLTEKYLQCQQRRAGQPGAQAEINGAAKRLGDFLDWLSNLGSEVEGTGEPGTGGNSGGGATPGGEEETAVPRVCTPPSGPPVEPPPEVKSVEDLEKANPTAGQSQEDRLRLDDIKALVEAAQGFSPARSLVASAQEEVQEFREGLLGEILSGLASPDLNDPERAEATVASNLVRILQAGQSLQADRLPNVSGVLIDVAAARLRSETARVEADRLKRLSELSDLRVRALAEELALLVRARVALGGSPADLDRSLRLYAQSWTQYRAPLTVIELDSINLAYGTWTARERATAEATYAMLEPALNELHEYGQGGITPATVASILGTIGIGLDLVEGE